MVSITPELCQNELVQGFSYYSGDARSNHFLFCLTKGLHDSFAIV